MRGTNTPSLTDFFHCAMRVVDSLKVLVGHVAMMPG